MSGTSAIGHVRDIGQVRHHRKDDRSDLPGEVLYPSLRRVVTCAAGLLRPVWVSAGKTIADCQAGTASSPNFADKIVLGCLFLSGSVVRQKGTQAVPSAAKVRSHRKLPAVHGRP